MHLSFCNLVVEAESDVLVASLELWKQLISQQGPAICSLSTLPTWMQVMPFLSYANACTLHAHQFRLPDRTWDTFFCRCLVRVT